MGSTWQSVTPSSGGKKAPIPLPTLCSYCNRQPVTAARGVIPRNPFWFFKCSSQRKSSDHFPSSFSTTTARVTMRSEEHTSELQSRLHLVCRLLLEKKKTTGPLHLPTEAVVWLETSPPWQANDLVRLLFDRVDELWV